MRRLLPSVAIAFLLIPAVSCPAAGPNVLMVAIDDQNDWIGCLGGHPQARTPHIDSLAARGTLFTNAHCQAPLCNPSRSSLLTGLRPSTTGIHGLVPGIRSVDATRNSVTLPQAFRGADYWTFTCGKVFHDGSLSPKERQAEFATWGPAPGMGRPPMPFAKLPQPRHPAMDWGPFPETESKAADHLIADAAIKALADAPKEKPFFIAAGFRLPHVPCFAPKAWFDLFPEDKVQLPPVLETDRDDTPRFSWYLHWKLPEPRLKTLRDHGEWKPLVRAYLASTAFMDAQVGRLLQALEKSGRSGETVVVLWSDHGYHLGEKLITGKNTLWERSTRVPLVFAGPGIARGARCGKPAELLDIYPTLVEMSGIPMERRPARLEGVSLKPQLADAGAPRDKPAITSHNQGNHAVRDERYRYIRYADGGEELYDMQADPNEWTNLAAMAEHSETKARLARWLPRVDVAAVPGSLHRVLIRDGATGAVTWEGQPILPTDPIPTP
jgi:arylsulfatase A-like enzyme